MAYADRVKETCTAAIGTGAISLAGAAAGFQTFASGFTVGATLPYCIVDASGNWEAGIGTLTGATTLTRGVSKSSNGNSLVNFGAGSKDVFCTPLATQLAALQVSQDIAFSAAVPFTAPGTQSMPPQTVTGVIAFTPNTAGAVGGASVEVDLLANGVDAPTFSGFREWSGSSGYVNTSGVRNCITFFRRAGFYWYAINQQFGAPVEAVLPSAVTGVTAGAVTSTTQVLSWTAPAAGTAPITYTVGYRLTSTGGAYTIASSAATSPYTVTGLTASTVYDYQVVPTNSAGPGTPGLLGAVSTAAALAAPGPVTALAAGTATASTIPLTWSAPSTGGGSITDYLVEYRLTGSGGYTTFTDAVTATTGATITGLTAATGYDIRVSAFNGSYGTTTTLTNVVTAAAAVLQVVRITNFLSGATESGDATNGWTYTAPNSSFGAGGETNIRFQAGVDGSIEHTLDVLTGHDVMLGVHTTSGQAHGYQTFQKGIWIPAGGTPNRTESNVFTPVTGVTIVAGDTIRLTRTGSTLVCAYKRGGVYTDFYTFPSVSTGVLYIGIDMAGAGAKSINLRGTGLA